MALRVAALVAVVVLGGSCVRFSLHTRPAIVSARLSADAAAAAFRQGLEAAALGQPISACPFAGDDAARAWKAGWKWWGGG
jgi:ribosome modulation factor